MINKKKSIICFITALGGYKKADSSEQSIDYKLSTGIILTFLIKNFKNETLLEPALEWEKK